MTKEFYDDKVKLIQAKINRLKDEKRELDKEYIKANAEFDIGEKVEIFTPPSKYHNNEAKSRFAFVTKREVSWGGSIDYVLVKCKKDGTPSQINDYYYGSTLKKIK